MVGGSTVDEGTVEVCYDELWGLISDVGWSDNDTVVVCNQLGYTGGGEINTVQYSTEKNYRCSYFQRLYPGLDHSMANLTRQFT